MRDQLGQLERVMRLLNDEHTQLLSLVHRKSEAMRQGKPALVSDCCEREHERVQKIAELEKQRQQIVALITESVDPNASAPLRMGEIADRAGEPVRGRLLVSQAQLRETLESIRQHNAVAKRAADGLLHHVRGVMQTVTRMVGDAGTYGRRGAIASPAAPVSSFSITG